MAKYRICLQYTGFNELCTHSEVYFQNISIVTLLER